MLNILYLSVIYLLSVVYHCLQYPFCQDKVDKDGHTFYRFTQVDLTDTWPNNVLSIKQAHVRYLV